MIKYIILKNPEAAKTKYLGAKDWTYNREEAIKFDSLVSAKNVIKDLTCQTCEVVNA